MECRAAEWIVIRAGMARSAPFRDADSRIGFAWRIGVRKRVEKHFHFVATERAKQAAPNDCQPEETVVQCNDADWQERQ